MPRRTTVGYWPSRKGGGFFCIKGGVRHELALGPDDRPGGPVYLAALRRFAEVMEESEQEGAEAASGAATVREVLAAYLDRVRKTRSPGTYEIRRRFLGDFAGHRPGAGRPMLGESPAAGLTHAAVYAFLERMAGTPRQARRRKRQERAGTTWNEGSQRACVQSLSAAFGWAARSGLLGRNPLAGIEAPPARSRGAEALLGATAEEAEAVHRRVLGAVPSSHREFVQALRDTGARPGELAAATAADFDPATGAIVFRKAATRAPGRFSHKTAGKGKDRVILLSGATLEAARRNAAAHPSGPLFRRCGGQPFRKPHVLSAFAKARRVLGLPRLTAYSYRHQFATSMLMAGMDIDSLAGLMGNSPQVLRQHYSHLLADRRGLREKLERFMRPAGAAGAPSPPANTGGGAEAASVPASPPPAPPSPRGRRRAAPG